MKKNKIISLVIIVFILIGSRNFATNVLLYGKEVEVPEHLNKSNLEVRGVWVNTVWQGFPTKTGLSEEAFYREYTELLDDLERSKINTVIFQIVPSGDAFFKSNINPVSEFLTGKQGTNFSYDPLPRMIEETHKRGMSFHAWVNPYRVTYRDMEGTKEDILMTLSSDNFARKNPECVFKAGKKLFLKPWNVKAAEHIKELIMEILNNYDVDAIHFDDYFYPASHLATENGYYEEEYEAFLQSGVSDINHFRRMQTDSLVFGVYQTIQGFNRGKKKNVEFGISPFGVWQNNKQSPEGMAVETNYTSYGTLFADTKKWVEEEWIDYVVPQVYWDFNNKGAAYGNITDWWANLCKKTNVKLYIGHDSSKLTNGDWTNPDIIYNQLAFNTRYTNIKGSFFFNHKTFERGTNANNQAFLNKFIDEVNSFSKNNSDRKTVLKFDVYKTAYGNLLHWVFNEDFNFFYIIKDKDKVIEIPKSGNSYFYLDYNEHGNSNYQIKIE